MHSYISLLHGNYAKWNSCVLVIYVAAVDYVNKLYVVNHMLLFPPYSLTAYPDPVTITGTGTRYINITWQPPTEVYSTIIRYSITCTGRGNSVSGQTRDSTLNTFILQELRPYTNYQCCVMTVTLLPGGSSQCVNTTTGEDGKCLTWLYVVYKQVSNTMFLVLEANCNYRGHSVLCEAQ